MTKIHLTEPKTYCCHRRRFERGWMGRLSHRQRLWLHPMLLELTGKNAFLAKMKEEYLRHDH